MRDASTEADARIVIDDLLRQAGWDPGDKSQVRTELGVRDLTAKWREAHMKDLPTEMEEQVRALGAPEGRPAKNTL